MFMSSNRGRGRRGHNLVVEDHYVYWPPERRVYTGYLGHNWILVGSACRCRQWSAACPGAFCLFRNRTSSLVRPCGQGKGRWRWPAWILEKSLHNEWCAAKSWASEGVPERDPSFSLLFLSPSQCLWVLGGVLGGTCCG
jgi:hypothetical protein